ncbi:MAG TPA: hypothetical protein VMR41_00410 [Patescibacteria group bacterium]|nr:hypothetical protein [Patescibacteria group bacterium]
MESVETEVLSYDPIVIKAKVVVRGKVFNGISSVSTDSSKFIEKQNPFEVAETSAVGRALGFAGYGLIENIASAEEVVNAVIKREQLPAIALEKQETEVVCEICGKPAVERKGTTKGGKPYHGIFCSSEDRTHTR